jgi:regulator of RNase E activity RraA
MSDDPLMVRAAAIASSTWSDALDRLRIAGCPIGLAWRSGHGRVAGRAVTIREEIAPLGGFPRPDFNVGAVIAAAGAGEVLVLDMSAAVVSGIGGLAASAAVKRGIRGVVVDGGCRDLAQVRSTGLAVASRHVTPISGKERARVAEINVPITCGGVAVAPGDVVILDETGVAVVPASRFEEVLALAEKLELNDQRFQAALDAGQEFGAIAATLGHV